MRELLLAFELTTVGVWLWDSRTNENFTSPSYAKMLGYSPGELAPRLDTFFELLHPDDRETVDRTVTGQRPVPESFEMEFRLRTRDGRWKWILSRGRVVERDKKGQPVRLAGIHLDIHERKLAEQARAEMENRYRTLVENQPDAVCRWLPDTTLTFVSEGYCRFYGQSREQLLGRPWLELVPEGALAEVRKKLRSLRRRPRVVRYSHQAMAVDGRVRYQEWVDCPLFDSQGQLTEFQSFGRDVTGQRLLEDALRRHQEDLERQVRERTAKLRQSLRDRSRQNRQITEYQNQLRLLAAELSLAEDRERRRIAAALHDGVQQNLFGLRTKVDLLQRLLKGRLQAQTDDLLDLIGRTMEDARSLTLEVYPPVLHEAGLTAALEWLTSRFEAEQGVSCRLEHEGAVELAVDVRGILFQHVRELLNNVRKHAHARQVVVRVRREGGTMRIWVLDDGKGFDPDSLDKQADHFGLFSIRERLRSLGGRMKILSRPGCGCQVCMSVPLRANRKRTSSRKRVSGT
ncbi:MAG: Sensor histidine kinase LiaS [Planctomycetes bacterium ADurb.Bin126]|nr:MAG: Sensor histidine kinase LiaS [Planctomycetes bacterium ADurb.Bin126]HOD79788.1 PAS domain S-box protein [Phycisphaerae bacterium]HQL72796.1 PAS domain S-box protein [Phycisphaerae bacterium]